jgi:hypothetical protein
MSRLQVGKCATKRRFTRKAEASQAIGIRRLAAYACPLCSGFHLTSKFDSSKLDKSVPQIQSEKPNFDTTLLARAKWVRPK